MNADFCFAVESTGERRDGLTFLPEIERDIGKVSERRSRNALWKEGEAKKGG